MIIDGRMLSVSLEQVLNDLRSDLSLNGILLFDKGFKNSGADIMIQCPYHSDGKEKRASAGIRKSDGQFHCFACGEVHTLPEVISYCFRKDDMGAFGWQWLLKKYISIEVEERTDVGLDLERDKNNVVGNRIVDIGNGSCESASIYISEKELDSYRYYHPYMYQRKLTNEIIELFDIGYDSKNECITFPIRDEKGNCLFIARRSVKYKYFNYPKGVEKPVYGLYELIRTSMPDELIICESMLDALTCWVYGKKAVALNGLGNELQFDQLRRLSCRKFILATDNDNAGMKARRRIRRNIKNKIITEYILPDNRKDINELSKEEFDKLEEVF